MADVIVQGVVKQRARFTAVDGVSLEVGAGEFLVLTGPPRSGKSVLLRLIAGEEQPDDGFVRLGDQAVSQREPTLVSTVRSGPVRGGQTVRQSLERPLRRAGVESDEVRRRSDLAGEAFGLTRLLNRELSRLNDELRTRVELARAIAAEPEAILIDISLDALDPDLRATFLEQLLRLRGRRGTAVVYATSDAEEALQLGARVAVMKEGRIEQIGDPTALLLRPASAEVAQHVRPELELHRGIVEGRRVQIPDLGTAVPARGVEPGGELLVALPTRPGAPPLLFDAETGRNLAAEADEPPAPLDDVARETAAEGSEPRYVNVHLRRGDEALAVPTSLETRRKYVVRATIGPYDDRSIVENARDVPWPAEHLPETADGHWLELVASSADFSIRDPSRRVFLPIRGRAWMCDCAQDQEHRCTEPDRRYEFDFDVTAPGRSGTGRLRLTAYHNLNPVQSLLVTANVGRRGGHRCVIDFSLTTHLSGVGRLRPRALSILTNDDEERLHRLYVNHDEGKPYTYSLSSDATSTAIEQAREYLFSAHVVEGTKDKLAYGKRNEKSRSDFVDDLRILASIGFELFTGTFPSVAKRRELVTALQEASVESNGEAVINVARTEGSSFMFPWYLVYDIPFSPRRKAVPCPFLAEWDPSSSTPVELPPSCPHQHDHELNVVCPYGFWGFAHIIDLPPFVDLDLPVRDSIRTAALAARLTITMGASPALDKKLTQNHIDVLEADFQRKVQPTWNGNDALEALAQDVDVAYFYCHGENEWTPKKKLVGPLLAFAKGDYIRPQDVHASNAPMGPWPDTHWVDVRPLVFINGCHTTDLKPELLTHFVAAFVGSRAAGVIGTEVSMHQQVAGEVAETFFRELAGDAGTVGRALQRTRRRLLAKGNVMGLAYTGYCSADLSLQPHGARPEGGRA